MAMASEDLLQQGGDWTRGARLFAHDLVQTREEVRDSVGVVHLQPDGDIVRLGDQHAVQHTRRLRCGGCILCSPRIRLCRSVPRDNRLFDSAIPFATGGPSCGEPPVAA